MVKWIRVAKKGTKRTIVFTDGKNRIIISKIKDNRWLLETKPKVTKLYFLSRNSAEYHARHNMMKD